MGRAYECMGDRRSVYTVCWDNLRARDYLEWKTLVLSRHVNWIDLAPGFGQLVGSCEHNNEPFGSIRCREFLN